MTHSLDWTDEVTTVDTIARTPAALDAIALGADELEILEALAYANDNALRALSAVGVR